MEEKFVTCPHCWEEISILVDPSVSGTQRYVEDCEVCCNPLDFTVTTSGGQVLSVDVEMAQ